MSSPIKSTAGTATPRRSELRILYLAHRLPYPPNKGDKIRSFHQIRSLARDHEVWLATLEDPEVGDDGVVALEKLCQAVCAVPLGKLPRLLRGGKSLLFGRSLTQGYFYSGALARTILGWIREHEFDVAFVFSSSMGPYLLPYPDLPKMIDFVDQDSRKWLEYGDQKKFPMNLLYRCEGRRLLGLEEELHRSFDGSIAITDEEAALFSESIPGAKVSVVGNGVDADFFSWHPAGRDAKDIVFTGMMDYYPNVDGVVRFVERMFPEIRRQVPECRFHIVGAKPTEAVTSLHDGEAVFVTGRVPDVRPYLHKSAVAVAPLRIGRGLQNKVLEALASGPAVVTTVEGHQGICGNPGEDLMVMSDEVGFVDAVVDLLQNPDRRQAMAIRGRKLVEERFSWEVQHERLQGMLEDVRRRG